LSAFPAACARGAEKQHDLIKVARGIFSTRAAQTIPQEQQREKNPSIALAGVD
jgi:hypothetical protein